MVKAVLFDLDGTLVDTLQSLCNAVNTVLEANGLPVHPVAAYRQFVGNGARVLVERASGLSDSTEIDRLLAAFLGEYDRQLLVGVEAYHGVTETLDRLLCEGVLLGVVTNKPHDQAKRLVEHLFGSRISCVFGGCDAYPKKPDPESTCLAAASLGVSLCDCVFVGDSDVDVQTAHAAGLACIGCCFGFRGEEELRTAGADDLVYSFTELRKNRLIFT